jgi:uncharacterized BrkB/YihY/UPF0761 family membrane protein
MDLTSFDNEAPHQAPRTTTVLVFLAAFAIMTSWLVVYAATNALVSANIISAWPPDADPRPRWMLNAFGGFFAAYAVIAMLFRWLSARQLRRIDAMADAEDRGGYGA